MKNKTKKFLQLPELLEGKEAFLKYIKDNLVYPKEALEKKIEGVVYLFGEINDNGIVQSVSVIKGIGAGCDEEAIRLIKNIKYTKVKNRGKRVKVKKRFRIKFKLPPQKNVIFNIVKNKKEEQSQEVEKKYSYTILVK